MAPAALGAPRSCETASVTTSLTPKIAPVITMMKASGTSPGTVYACSVGRSWCGTTGGSVERAEMKTRTPTV